MNRFNPQQFAQTIRAQGGASASVHTGKAPDNGYFVSQPRTEKVISGYPQGSDVEGFVSEQSKALKPKGAYVGAWVEGHGGDNPETFMDVSRHFKPENKRKAVQRGMEYGQWAIYDAGKDDVINLHSPKRLNGLFGTSPDARKWERQNRNESRGHHVNKAREALEEERVLKQQRATTPKQQGRQLRLFR